MTCYEIIEGEIAIMLILKILNHLEKWLLWIYLQQR